jgi:hypothetical protein
MTPRSRSARNRDIALTTLIDLLVQVVFVFTLILIAVDVVDGDPQKQGWVTPDAWKTLISIFDVDPQTIREPGAQLGEIVGKYDQLKHDLLACDGKAAACEKQAGRGPGNAPCRDERGVEMVVAEATIDHQGRITVAPGRHSAPLQQERPLAASAVGVPLTVEEFGALFRPWREHGLARQPACAFKAEMRYDPRAPAGAYEPARRAVASYFSLSAPPRRF